jgi:hypothetical protein
MTTAPDWGPWKASIDAAERMARCRVLAALVHTLARPRGLALETALYAAAAGNDEALEDAATHLRSLPPLMARHVIAAFAATALAAARARS